MKKDIRATMIWGKMYLWVRRPSDGKMVLEPVGKPRLEMPVGEDGVPLRTLPMTSFETEVELSE